MTVPLEQKYYSPKEVQKIFSISRSHFYNLLREGKFEAIKINGKMTRIPADSIENYFASCPKYKGKHLTKSNR